MDTQSELELARHYEAIRDYPKYNNNIIPQPFISRYHSAHISDYKLNFLISFTIFGCDSMYCSALRMVERSAEHGSVEAQLQLGKLYQLGNQT